MVLLAVLVTILVVLVLVVSVLPWLTMPPLPQECGRVGLTYIYLPLQSKVDLLAPPLESS